MRNIPEEIVKLTEAYDYLITTGRQQIRVMIKAAMQNGKDLPENTEYLEAKEEQARLEERIIELRALLEDLKNQTGFAASMEGRYYIDHMRCSFLYATYPSMIYLLHIYLLLLLRIDLAVQNRTAIRFETFSYRHLHIVLGIIVLHLQLDL